MSRIVRVVPDVTTFAVDEGFSYTLPDDLDAAIGSLVRVPLGGRTVRGWIVTFEAGDPTSLKPVKRVSGTLPVFDEALLATFRWLAHHYVAPLATILRSATPPTLPTRLPKEAPVRTRRATTRHHVRDLRALDETLAGRSGSTLVVAPTEREVAETADALATGGRDVVVVPPSLTGRAVTQAWTRGRLDGDVTIVGSGRVASWWIPDLETVVLVDDGRRSHKERQTPTIHSRTLLSHRATVEGLSMITTGLVPTLETVADGARVDADGRRWPLVEIVDRNEEPPGRGVLSERVKQAVRHAINQERTTLVFTHRRGYAPAFRCTSCRELRQCVSCRSAATNAGVCPRCGAMYQPCASCGGRSFEPLGAAMGRVTDLLGRLVGPDRVGEVGSRAPVQVGTERDLVRARGIDLGVIVDADRLILGTNYRAAEDAVRLMARVAGLVVPGTGQRLMVQTAVPDHAAIAALRQGDAAEFLKAELATRVEAGLPPSGDVVVLEARGDATLSDADLDALDAAGGLVFGPQPSARGTRWLIQGPDLGRVKRELRPIVRRLRDAGSDVRVDVDPIDL